MRTSALGIALRLLILFLSVLPAADARAGVLQTDVPCQNDFDCHANLSEYHHSRCNGTCVFYQCYEDKDCGAGRCVENSCVDCTSSADCATNSKGPFCEKYACSPGPDLALGVLGSSDGKFFPMVEGAVNGWGTRGAGCGYVNTNSLSINTLCSNNCSPACVAFLENNRCGINLIKNDKSNHAYGDNDWTDYACNQKEVSRYLFTCKDNNNGVCVAGVPDRLNLECTMNSECSDRSKPYCNAGKCQSGPVLTMRFMSSSGTNITPEVEGVSNGFGTRGAGCGYVNRSSLSSYRPCSPANPCELACVVFLEDGKCGINRLNNDRSNPAYGDNAWENLACNQQEVSKYLLTCKDNGSGLCRAGIPDRMNACTSNVECAGNSSKPYCYAGTCQAGPNLVLDVLKSSTNNFYPKVENAINGWGARGAGCGYVTTGDLTRYSPCDSSSNCQPACVAFLENNQCGVNLIKDDKGNHAFEDNVWENRACNQQEASRYLLTCKDNNNGICIPGIPDGIKDRNGAECTMNVDCMHRQGVAGPVCYGGTCKQGPKSVVLSFLPDSGTNRYPVVENISNGWGTLGAGCGYISPDNLQSFKPCGPGNECKFACVAFQSNNQCGINYIDDNKTQSRLDDNAWENKSCNHREVAKYLLTCIDNDNGICIPGSPAPVYSKDPLNEILPCTNASNSRCLTTATDGSNEKRVLVQAVLNGASGTSYWIWAKKNCPGINWKSSSSLPLSASTAQSCLGMPIDLYATPGSSNSSNPDFVTLRLKMGPDPTDTGTQNKLLYGILVGVETPGLFPWKLSGRRLLNTDGTQCLQKPVALPSTTANASPWYAQIGPLSSGACAEVSFESYPMP